MSKKIDFIHSLIFFNLCIILSAITFIQNQNFLLFCLFLIMSLGISHGSLDNLKGEKLLKIYKIKQIEKFYFSYICLSFFVILLWILLPTFLLVIFLLIASYHFGKEDTVYKSEVIGLKKDILFLLKGSLVITAPLFFNYDKTNEIFLMLNFNLFSEFIVSKEILFLLIFLSFLSGLNLSKFKNIDDSTLSIMDFLSITAISG